MTKINFLHMILSLSCHFYFYFISVEYHTLTVLRNFQSLTLMGLIRANRGRNKVIHVNSTDGQLC